MCHPKSKRKLNHLHSFYLKKEALKPANEDVKHGQIIADAVYFTRDLINTPHRIKTPAILADTAKKLAKEPGVQCEYYLNQNLKAWDGRHTGRFTGQYPTPEIYHTREYNARAKNQDTIVFVGKRAHL